ncbi:helix-turn-helix domain-containing protein [Nonomuraea sp. NEAU-A123]|uniref:TetR/AcrR family transcriptional regulator n=1 Tax=Nonomuraea sp. NEAU-A123 TaxID=2839649 RepID=UPI0027DF7032|nr:helix-turn-helix domain-containing protein [Nonomuraea sp. NEAU-A123]
MVTQTERHLRADAARNVERILRTARAVFADAGPDVPLEEIARRAGVGIRTLYRHFPHKGDLVRAILDQSVAEDLAPAIERALVDDNPLHGLTTLIETAVAMVSREMNTLAAAKDAGSLTPDLSTAFFEALSLLARRAQQAGLLRADIVQDDLPRIMAMLVSTLWSMDLKTEGWRRYLALILDALSPAAASTLTPAAALVKSPRAGNWLL